MRTLAEESSISEDIFSRGSQHEFAELLGRIVAEWGIMIRGIFRNHGCHEQDVDDCFQNLFAALIQKRSSFDPSRKLRPWILQIARNTAIDLSRRKSRQDRLLPALDFEPISYDSGPVVAAMQHETEQQMLQAMMQLKRDNPALALIISLHYCKGRTTKEIATALSIPQSTVKNRLIIARTKIREILEGSTPDPQSARHQGDLPHAAPRVHRSQTA